MAASRLFGRQFSYDLSNIPEDYQRALTIVIHHVAAPLNPKPNQTVTPGPNELDRTALVLIPKSHQTAAVGTRLHK